MNKILNYVLGVVVVLLVGFIVVSGKAEVNLGIAQNASKFTNVEVTNELQAGKVTLTGVVGDARIASLVQTGSIATFTTTSAATAANVCNSRLFTTTGATTTTVTLPATSTLFADCLTTNGDSVSFAVLNISDTTSTIVAAGTGGTMLYESSLTIAAAKAAYITIVRDAATTYKALMVSLDN